MGPYIWASAAVFLAFLTLVQTVSVCASPSHPQHVPRVSHVARSLVAPKHGASQVTRRQSQARNQTVVTSPAGVRIRYKEITGQVCELSEGVRSFSGYVDLSGNRSTYFTLFEARTKPQTAPITLWLSGNPGQDSLTGLYQSLGPCRISADLEPVTIKDSWTEHSNMIFLSQPTSVGFSSHLGDVRPKIADGTTQEATTEVLEAFQAIVAAMPQIDDRIKSTDFHLATDSYGGYYGPAFLRYFCQQNRNELRGQSQATSLVMKSLTLLSGWIDDYLQNAYYPIFANNNTLSLKFYNDTMYGKVAKAYGRSGGCKDQIQACRSNGSASLDVTLCSAAVQVCYEEVERPFYDISGRSPSNIALATNEGDLPKDFVRYLNLPSVQAVLGMHDKYTSKPDILEAFTGSTQFASGSFRRDLENLIDSGVRVSLVYGDAQYRTNWLGGEAVSLALEYGGADQLRAAPYMPFVVEGIQYGETRSFGGLSFTRIDQSGAQIPFYQPLAARTLFQRVVGGLAIADGGQLPSPTRAQSCEMPDQVEGTENLGLSTVMSKGTPLSTSRGFSSTQSSVTASANEADMPVGTTSLEEVAVINASSTSKTNPKITGILGGEGLTITEVSPEGPPSAEPSEVKGGARLRMGTFGRHRWISMVLPATLCILL